MDLASVGIEQDIVFRSSVEFPGATKGIYGWGKSFHWTTFPALQKSPIEFETKSGDRLQKYRIRVERNDARVDWLNPKSETGPNYKIMATDGVQKGLVITDNGFPKADSAETLGEYIAFFKEKGFKFSDKPVENFSKYLEEEVSSGRMDYLIREGHNSMATFSLYNKGTLRIGRKPGNPAQEIVVFMPNNKASHLKNFSWPSMGEWLDKRGKGKPLYFVDTKCSSANSICNVLPQVKNANLQFIAPLNTATTFINHPTSPLRSLTEGLIERKPYAVMDSKITAAKKKSKIHAQKNGESYDFEEDNYIYPSSPDYKSDIQKLKEHAASGGTFIVEKKDENGVFQTLESEDFSSVFGQ
ncbi:MAG: hypothetical protein ABIR96_10210 [Bdellovibrionota bacterium]